MSDMKCPFCKEEIISDLCLMCDKIDKGYTSGRQIYKCNKCGLFGNKELVQELIRTRKALGIARNALKDITIVRCGLEDFEPKAVTMTRIAEKALEQIEHKEDK